MQQSEKRRNRGFYLKQRENTGNPDIWYICWSVKVRPGKYKVERVSTFTTDYKAAQEALADHISQHGVIKDLQAETTTLAFALDNYWKKVSVHKKTDAARLPDRYAIKDVMELLGDTTTIAQFDMSLQEKFINTLRRKGPPADWLPGVRPTALSAGTVIRRQTSIRAAINRLVAEKALAESDVPTFVEVKKTKAIGVPAFDDEQMKKIFETATSRNDRLFVLLMTVGMPRPSQILELTWDRVSFKHPMTIDFQVPGDEETNKGRAVVPMSETVANYLRPLVQPGKHVIQDVYDGSPNVTYDNNFDRLLARAGITKMTPKGVKKDGSPYGIRKYSAGVLANAGIPEIQIKYMLAHKYSTGETWRYPKAQTLPILVELDKMLKALKPSWIEFPETARDDAAVQRIQTLLGVTRNQAEAMYDVSQAAQT